MKLRYLVCLLDPKEKHVPDGYYTSTEKRHRLLEMRTFDSSEEAVEFIRESLGKKDWTSDQYTILPVYGQEH